VGLSGILRCRGQFGEFGVDLGDALRAGGGAVVAGDVAVVAAAQRPVGLGSVAADAYVPGLGVADGVGELDRGEHGTDCGGEGGVDGGSADDYITKPFAIGELLARLRASTRRTPAEPTAPVRIGDLVVDLTARTVTRSSTDGEQQRIRLTPTEWRLLEALLEHPGKLVSQNQLLAKTWGAVGQDKGHYLGLYMARLRGKLEPDQHHPQYLLTEPGMGYRFQP
jgi:DNA-binding winged helix-turn-helix (wHTH) protein